MDSLNTKDKVNNCVNKTSVLGQYFTPRQNDISIIEIRNKLLDSIDTINIISMSSGTFTHTINNTMNTKENELIENILDPFAGAGSFSTMNNDNDNDKNKIITNGN